MKFIANLMRFFAKLRFRILGLATITDIPTDKFNSLLESMITSGWEKIYEYSGFDAWIDYGKVKIKKGGVKLIFEWDNWTEGSVVGKVKVIKSLAVECHYIVDAFLCHYIVDTQLV